MEFSNVKWMMFRLPFHFAGNQIENRQSKTQATGRWLG